MTLNVLLLEDDPAKKARLISFLGQSKDLFSSIDTALCVKDARARLIEKKYDLFVVDVIVPHELGELASEENSIALLEAIDDGRDKIIRPTHMLPVSASNELSLTAQDFFRGRPWGILPYTESTPDCLAAIERVSRFILAEKNHDSARRTVDVFLITALLEPEYAALERLGINWGSFEPLDASQLIRYAEFQVGERTLKIAAAFSPRMGPVAASMLTTKAMLYLSPKLVLMTGICAGVPSKAGIGDVIAAETSWDWQSGKFVDKDGSEAFEIAPHQIGITAAAKNQLLLMKRDEKFWASLSAPALAAKQKMPPKLVIGPVASGSSVLADARVVDRLKKSQHKNLAGLDMETYAVYAATEACNADSIVISLKSVCDKGDIKKNDEFQRYASEISSATALHFLQNYAEPLLR